jgi:hypothetical protein
VRNLPTVSEFGGMKILLYFDDHDPPHVHIIGEDRAEVYINYEQDGFYKAGVLPVKKEKVIKEWINAYYDDIMKAWNLCREFQNPGKIPPLY